ncbi:MAG TPA: hypothetical protein VFV38_07170 [Ktedonobacteraceae bacterium]|nr:hypothetical protein [Ktedonobacteraceae bacterium]
MHLWRRYDRKRQTAVPSSERLRLCSSGQSEEAHPEWLPLDFGQGLLHRVPDHLPGASSDYLCGDARAREAQEDQQGEEPPGPPMQLAVEIGPAFAANGSAKPLSPNADPTDASRPAGLGTLRGR